MKLARQRDIAPFHAMEVMRAANERAQAGGDVLHMEVGQPSTPAPKRVIAAAARALKTETLGYTVALGRSDLRAAIAKHYRDRYGVAVPAERIVITTGSSGAFILAFLALFDAGDRVALCEPGYPCYRNILHALGVECAMMPIGAADQFRLTPAAFTGLPGPIHGLLVASPANPTGTMLDAAALGALADACRARDAWLIVDEIYHGITYGKPAATILGLTDRAIVINSFSKYFSMTGWRLGWMVVPEELLKPIERLAQNLFISPPSLSQVAGLAAFEAYDELDANVARYGANRALLLNELPAAGFDRIAPADGAFYLYADVSRFTNDADEFCRRLLNETGVAATPGIDFDRAQGNRFVRLAFAGATADVREAARRLKAWQK
jgi:aspartate/methionine/tyrosine aminotransferase